MIFVVEKSTTINGKAYLTNSHTSQSAATAIIFVVFESMERLNK